MFTNRKKIKISGVTASHKKALAKSLVVELIRNGKIKTTPKKAKLLKSSFDKLVTAYKKETEAGNRVVSSFLGGNKRAVERLGTVVKKYLNDRNSGYTHVVKTTSRPGDNSAQSYVMLVNFEGKEIKSKVKETLKKQEEKKGKTKGIAKRVRKAVSGK